MNKLIHIIRYNTNKAYKKQYDDKKRFAKIMYVNKSIMEGLK